MSRRRSRGCELFFLTVTVGAALVLLANPGMLPAYLLSTAPEVYDALRGAFR